MIHWIHLFFRLVFFLICFSGVSASVRRRFFLTIRRSVLPDCVSLHAAFLFLLPFRLVRSCFGASLPSSRFVCFWSNFLCGFTILYRLLSSVRSPPSRDSIPSLVCANLLSVASPSLSVTVISSFLSLLYSSVLLPLFRLLLCSSWLRVLLGHLLLFPLCFS